MNLKTLTERIAYFQDNIENILLEVISERGDDVVQYVKDQLFIEGLRGEDGQFIADYDPYTLTTVRIKREKGQPTDRVTLKDTGAFHDSINIEITGNGFTIVARDEKTSKLIDRYGEVLNLSNENVHSMIWGILHPEMIKRLNDIINGRDSI